MSTHPDILDIYSQIRLIERNQEIPHKGAFCDLVWSDPEEVDNSIQQSHFPHITIFPSKIIFSHPDKTCILTNLKLL